MAISQHSYLAICRAKVRDRQAAWGASSLLLVVCALVVTDSPAVLGARVDPDPLSAMQLLREGGCGGLLPPARTLTPNALLDHAARDWAEGKTLAAATERSGYLAEKSSGLHVTGPDSTIVQTLRRSSCITLTNRSMQDVGLYRRGADTWFVLAAKYAVPSGAQAPELASRVLDLVNQARARTVRCGEKTFSPARPLALSGTLDGVALGHASDMADNDYFEHTDLSGHTPADRVRAVGYREKLVGENIAFGPRTADEVVQGWLDSPGHCENIMDPRFVEMGVAFAPAHRKRGLYWVQVLTQPRA
jgi:uncharacterized protein YkwD